MKKLINILFLVILSVSIFAQERTVSKDFRRTGDTYYKYTGTAADTLIATNQDTIDYVFKVMQHYFVKKIDVKIRYDVVAGADTTVSAQLDGKEFSDQTTYTSIISAANSSAVAANNTVHIISSDYTESIGAHTLLTDTTGLSGYPADSIAVPAQTVTPADKSFRYYRLRLIIAGDDATGTGIKVDEIEIKLYTD